MAFGAVHRPAFTNLEALVLVAVAAWIAKAWRERPAAVRLRIPRVEFRRLAVPALALTGVFALQLIPFPARVLNVLAPSTARLYRISFPGWPAFSPYQTLAPIWSFTATKVAPDNLQGRAQSFPPTSAGPLAPALPIDQAGAPPLSSLALRFHWRPLSLAPSATRSGIIEWLVLAALFLVVLLYPFGLVGERDAELRFYRIVLVTAVATAAALAALGLIERAWWNGRLLWFYVPEDWGGALPNIIPRASGPFVDPDHFANYLAMLLPLSAMLALYPLRIVRREQRANLQLFAALASLVVVVALLLSFSRAGWAAAAAGTAVALVLGARHSAGILPARLTATRWLIRALVAAAFAFGLGVILFAAGPLGRSLLTARLTGVLTGADDVHFRPAVWRDTLKMVLDFPVFGVGLGAWPEAFPHYQRPPWIPFFFRAAENDYVQFIAETGVVGVLALGWLAATLTGVLRRGGQHLPEGYWPLLAGLLGGLVAAIVHEGFDFALRTPANAFLFAILLGLAMRVALGEGLGAVAPEIRPAPRVGHEPYLLVPLAVVTVVCLVVAIYAQDGGAYPYGVLVEHDLRRAEMNLTTHPAMSAAHLRLAQLLDRGVPAEIPLVLLRAAVWLDPNDPAARDRYAQALLHAGRRDAGFAQVTASVFHAPHYGAHQYLTPDLIPWLLPTEQTAIKEGFEQAIAAGFPGTIDILAGFYRELGRYRDISELYAGAAQTTDDPAVKLAYLVEAGRSYGLLGDSAEAIRTLQAASAIAPGDPRPYVELTQSVFGPAGQMPLARSTIEQGIRAGADPYTLYLALADTAEQAHDHPTAEVALEQAFAVHGSFGLAMRLGNLYLDDQQFDRAVRTLARATALDPTSVPAWIALGQANEKAYDYYAAGQAYARARALAPGDPAISAIYADFQRRTAASAAPDQGATHGGATPEAGSAALPLPSASGDR